MIKEFLCGLFFCITIAATTAQVADSTNAKEGFPLFLKHAVGVVSADLLNKGFAYRHYAAQQWAIQASYAPQFGVKPQAYQKHTAGLMVLYAFYAGKVMSYYIFQGNGFSYSVYKKSSSFRTNSGVGLGAEIKLAKKIGINITADIHREFYSHNTVFGLGSAILYKF